ncbi:MAG: hypothetical protein KDA51_10300, partial [Planctomycetales bacterium]|nr:hypothetical protein [Planctomycetales bacterium]
RFDVTSDVEAVLAGIVVNDRRYFDVVERRRLNSLLSEVTLAERGLVDSSTASRLGKMLGANGVYMGKVTNSAWSDQHSTEPRTICARREMKRHKNGNTYEGGCVRWRSTVAKCTTRTAKFEFVPKLVSIETGAIVYSRAHSGEQVAMSCREPDTGASAPISDGAQLLIEAKKEALESFRRDIAPMQTTRTIDVLGATERIRSPQMKERFSNALAFAKEHRLDRACEMWREIALSEHDSPELSHNLGVCLEVTGDLDSALSHYNQADRLLAQPNKSISAALDRVQSDMASRVRLKAQMRR